MNSMFRKARYITLIILYVMGLGVSLYLAYEYSKTEPINCPVGGSSCETVRLSKYSSLLGQPIPIWGVLYFLFTLFYMLQPLVLKEVNVKKFMSGLILLILAGFLFESYLTLLEIFVIKAVCAWCFVVEITITASLAIVLYFAKYPLLHPQDQ